MPIAIHWDGEGHSASKPLQSSLELHSEQLPGAPFKFLLFLFFRTRSEHSKYTNSRYTVISDARKVTT